MSIKHLLTISLVIIGCAPIFFVHSSFARQTVVAGSIGVGFDYENRTYDDEDLVFDPTDGDRRELSLIPEIEVRSLGQHNVMTLRYSPVLVYDDLDDETDLDHYLDLLGEHFIDKNWSVQLSDNFVYSTDPSRFGTTFDSGGEAIDEEVTVPDEITQNLGRTRYWTNNLTLQTTYTYKAESDLGIGYAYRVLRNDSDTDSADTAYDEYDRHEVFGLWSNRINAFLSTQLDLSYIRGLYDDDPDTGLSQDLDEYGTDVLLSYERDVSNTFPFLYSLDGTQYEDTRRDIWAHELTAGWEHSFDSRTSIAIGAGPSYIEADGLDGEWGYNANVLFNRKYQHSDISFLVDKRYEPRNFTGSDDSGLTDITDVRLDLSYQFSQDILSTLFAAYRYEDIVEPQGDFLDSALGGSDPAGADSVGDVSYSRDSYSAGASLDYTFLRWFVATFRYVYFTQDGDLAEDSYEDHRVTFQISASKELWR